MRSIVRPEGSVMTATETKTFPHRRNPDASFDSICPMCFRTIIRCKHETDLAPFEQDHHCDPYALEHFHGVRPVTGELDHRAR